MVDEWSTRQDVEELHEPDRDWNRCAPEIQEVFDGGVETGPREGRGALGVGDWLDAPERGEARGDGWLCVGALRAT